MLGVFAAFLRDSIKRVAISGMTLPEVALADDVGGFNTACKTHADIALCEVTFHQIHLHCSIRDGNLLSRKKIKRKLRCLVMSGGIRIDWAIAHRWENFEEK